MENPSTKRVNRKYLTDDLWYEIFLRLTLESIFRFKCVSKVWFSILSNPNFINEWHKINISLLPWGFVHDVPLPEGILKRTYKCAFPGLHSRYISHHGFSFRFLLKVVDHQTRYHVHLLGSSNGLVLCRISLRHQSGYYVCNPLTQTFVLLPPPPGNNYAKTVTGFVCSEECFSEPTSYKIVRIPKVEAPTKEIEVEIFSSDSGEWNVYNVSCPPNATWEFNSSDSYVTHKGVMYWFQKRKNKILAFSVSGNSTSSSLIDMPNLEVNGNDIQILSQFLGESEGLICLARFKKSEESLSVWVLDGDCWYMLHKDVKLHDRLAEMESQLIDGSGGEDVINGFKVGIEVVGFSPVDKNVVILSYDKNVWAYNTRTRVHEQLLHPPFLCNNRHPVHYSRTLAFLLKPRPTILPLISWDASYRVDKRRGTALA